jgi:hypothetical protein
MSKRDFITDVVIANSSPDELVNLALSYLDETTPVDDQEWPMLFVVSDLLQYTDIEDNVLNITCSEAPDAEENNMTYGEFAHMYAASVLMDDQSRRLDILGQITASMPQLVDHANNLALTLHMIETAGFELAGKEEDMFKHEARLEPTAPNGSHLRVLPKQ